MVHPQSPAPRSCSVLPVLGHDVIGGLAYGGAELRTDRGEDRAHEPGNLLPTTRYFNHEHHRESVDRCVHLGVKVALYLIE